jgi:hypothetical protein
MGQLLALPWWTWLVLVAVGLVAFGGGWSGDPYLDDLDDLEDEEDA